VLPDGLDVIHVRNDTGADAGSFPMGRTGRPFPMCTTTEGSELARWELIGRAACHDLGEGRSAPGPGGR
jgi:hypothetical protein